MNRTQKFSIFILCLLISDMSLSFASKIDKKHDKHKAVTQSSQLKTTSPPHHSSNHTSHANKTEVSHDHLETPNGQAHLPIGWSLDKNQHQQHHNNPNGYAIQHHEQQHGMSSGHQTGGHGQANVQQTGGHDHIQPSNVNQPQQSSGIGGALAAGAGGLALGAGGGYLLSNMMNSGGKSGEKVDETTVEPSTEAKKLETDSTAAPTTLQTESTTAESPVEVQTTPEGFTTSTDPPSSTSEVPQATTESPQVPTESPPIILAAGLIPVVQSANIPSETKENIDPITESTLTPQTTTKNNSSMIKSSFGFAILFVVIQFLMNFN